MLWLIDIGAFFRWLFKGCKTIHGIDSECKQRTSHSKLWIVLLEYLSIKRNRPLMPEFSFFNLQFAV